MRLFTSRSFYAEFTTQVREGRVGDEWMGKATGCIRHTAENLGGTIFKAVYAERMV